MKIPRPRRPALAFTVVVACSACGPATPVKGGPPPVTSSPTPPPAPAGSVAKFFPLLNGHIYQYVTETDSGEGMMITRVTRADGQSGDLQGPRGTKTFRYVDDGVVLATDSTAAVYVLKTPFAVGTKWRGQAGSTVEIVEVGANVTVPAGTYAGCIKTLEQRGGDRPMRVATTYCPETGIVQLEAASGMVSERAVLKSYGPPLDLGPDGVRAFPPDQKQPAPP
jgi:hypothetical protein